MLIHVHDRVYNAWTCCCSDTYIDARARLARATETSTLETDDDDEAVARSRLKRRKNFSDVEDDNQSEVIATPKLMKPVKKPVISHDVPVPSGLLSGGKGQRFSSI